MKTMFARSSKDGRRSASATRNSLSRSSGWKVELISGTRFTTSKRVVSVASMKEAREVVREFIAA